MNEQMLRAYKASGISERMLQTPYAREPVQTIAQYKDMQRKYVIFHIIANFLHCFLFSAGKARCILLVREFKAWDCMLSVILI